MMVFGKDLFEKDFVCLSPERTDTRLATVRAAVKINEEGTNDNLSLTP